jgi:sulfoxide reductase heme-binding subunit YedZ
MNALLLNPAVVGDLNIAWVTTRAAGIVALLASTGSIVLGLSLAGRMPKGRGKLGDVRMLHQTLGIATVVALAVHVISLLFDPWLKPAISELAIPFTLGYRPVWTGVGIIAGYGIAVLGMSGFLRKRLGSHWNLIHRFTGLAWGASIAHAIGSGSDAGSVWMLALLAVCVAPVALLTAKRIAEARQKATPNTLRPRATAP